MAGMNDIKARIKSVEGTMQITKAMELVATSKLRRAKETVERTRPFYQVLGNAIDDIVSLSADSELCWFEKNATDKTLFIVFAGDRGLAGGYNSNVFRLAASLMREGDSVLPIGKKALEHYKHRSADIFSAGYEYASDVSVGRALDLSGLVSEAYRNGEFKKVVLIYTKFVSMMTQTAVSETLLPINIDPDDEGDSSDVIFEGDPEEMLDKIIPHYIGGIITCAIAESLASESGARRTAMNSANKNATEMIDSLMLQFNRARQAVITQEITEIVSGSEAL
jgi:F-type H+-transporting ATPase subunit gamma